LSILPHLSHLQFQDFINTMSLSLISSVLWVPRGASAQHPRRYDLSDPAELERVERLGKIKLEDARRELEELEKGVDGMQVDAEEDDDNGEEWESDNSADEPSESEEDSESGEDPEKKARKMQASIKQGAAAGSKANGVDDEEDEMKKYNLDSYDTEVSKSKSANYFDTAIGKRD
jgi:periodic tryptophan protein 1